MVKAISSQACKVCSKCKEEKSLDEFYFRKKRGHSARCKSCIKQANHEYYLKNKPHIIEVNNEYRKQNWRKNADKRKKYHQKRQQDLKLAALKLYGMECVCCGESGFEFLTLDHVNNDGHVHREEMNYRNIYEWLSNHNYECPFELQTLCYNCNFAKRYNGGVCPHQEGSETIR